MTGAWLWAIPAAPLLGFVGLTFAGRALPARAISGIGVGTVILAFLLSVALATNRPLAHTLAPWFDVGGFSPVFALRLDGLSAAWTLVITGVGALIHLHATEYLRGDEGYARFFAYMNLFVAAMLVLVLADDLLLMFLGWEGVGLCSYLLIGFWYRDPANGRAARKAFVVTRIGDTALLIGLLLLSTELGTLRIPDLLEGATANWRPGEMLPLLAALLLLGGAVGKSAQLPLQVWLPDAMAGPTPVSALLHAATMVTAGVYLIARMHALFLLAPLAMDVVAAIGAVTLLLAGFTALAQRDIKRVLAWSTVSQIGYMFLALGAGAWDAAVFHFVTHAFFKALLFLGAGSILLALHHEQDIYAMGGLRRRLPIVFWTFLVGSLSLAGFPFFTAGFYSKDAILLGAAAESPILWAVGWFGAVLTAVYTFRLVFLVFFGEVRTEPTHPPGWAATVPLVALAALAILGGALELPGYLGGFAPLSALLEGVMPEGAHPEGLSEGPLVAAAALASIGGIALAWWLYRPSGFRAGAAPGAVARFLRSGFAFDRLYDLAVVQPYARLGALNRNDAIDRLYDGIAALSTLGHRGLARTQSGRVRWSLAALGGGAALLLALALGVG